MSAPAVLRALGAYYILTGAFPLVSMRGFEAITGPKTDRWLVQMVGLLAVVNGATFVAGARTRPGAQTVLLAYGSIAAFTAIDVVHVLRRRISPVYLCDAAVEVAFGAVLGLALGRGESDPGRESTGGSGT